MTQFIHVGYPKTGTTWLQKQIFPYIENHKKIIKGIILKNITSSLVSEPEI